MIWNGQSLLALSDGLKKEDGGVIKENKT